MNKNNQQHKSAEQHLKLGAVTSFTEHLPYQSDPLAVFHTLCSNEGDNESGDKNGKLKANTLLLESAEIDKKHQLKSLLLTDTAVKIVCHGNSVTFTALSQNGEHALAFAKQQLSAEAAISDSVSANANSDTLAFTATFSDVAEQLDERSRLLATNPFQSLRLFQQLTNLTGHPFSVFLGGAFAFDMMAVSEALPSVDDGENTCPDFVFYLAETLIVIDHEQQSSEVITNMFTGENYSQAKSAQIARME